MILNIQYSLCFTNFCEIARIFDKKFIYCRNEIKCTQELFVEDWKGGRKTPVLLCSQYAQSFIEKSPVLRISWVCKSIAANKILRWCRQGSDSRKAVNKSARDITVSTAYCSISKSTVRPVRLWDTYFLFLKTNNKHFHFHATRQVELFMLHWFKAKFIRGIVFFYRHLILCNAISYATAERRMK